MRRSTVLTSIPWCNVLQLTYQLSDLKELVNVRFSGKEGIPGPHLGVEAADSPGVIANLLFAFVTETPDK